MATQSIEAKRVQHLNDRAAADGRYVLYWMQRAQRAELNHALEYAIREANRLGQRLLVAFGLMDDYPEANLRHYRFMLEGLLETVGALKRRKIKMVVRRGHPAEVALQLAAEASLVVCDRGYLRHEKRWRDQLADEAECRVTQVETDLIVPVEVASRKVEWAARTIRPKIHEHLSRYLVALRPTPIEKDSTNLRVNGLDAGDLDGVLSDLRVDRSVAPVHRFFRGGTREAKKVLRRFLAKRLKDYANNRNRPETDDVSYMGMYLHFGHISPLYIAMQVNERRSSSRDSYIEELLVRRELAHNFVHFCPIYDRWDCLPDWAQRTLRQHAADKREPSYDRETLEAAATHDPYWNAAMNEMKHTGYLHNYMRMYWGKKILEWMGSPEKAYRTALALNNKYLLDGRDPNSYANVAWIFGLHDRPWQERSIFGTVRYMSAAGLERKCDAEAYVEKIDRLVERARQAAV